MLRLSMRTEESLMIGNNIKIVFLGGTHNHLRVMIDAPEELEIVRSTVLERENPHLKETATKYYAVPELPKRFQKKKSQSKLSER